MMLIQYLKQFNLRVVIMRCFRCGDKLEIEYEEMETDYPLQCWNCDENMFIFDAVVLFT